MITSEESIGIFISDEKNKAHRGWITCHGPTLMSTVLRFTPVEPGLRVYAAS